MFDMERLNHCETQVYGFACVSAGVDTSESADKLRKAENILKFERFDVFSELVGAPPEIPAGKGGWEHPFCGFVCSAVPRAALRFGHDPDDRLDEPRYLPAASHETPAVPIPPRSLDEDSISTPVGSSWVGRQSVDGHANGARVAGEPWSVRGRSDGNSRAEPDAAHALQSHCSTCWGVQDGSITGWEDCTISQHLAGRQWDEEMAQ
jgi:hypothetical protein